MQRWKDGWTNGCPLWDMKIQTDANERDSVVSSETQHKTNGWTDGWMDGQLDGWMD